MTAARDKMTTMAGLAERAERARAEGRAVVLCHGVFDLLHLGHVRHLQAARAEGDLLFVTLTADRFVNKGPGRPIFGADLRAEMLASLAMVDGVAVNESPTAETVLRTVRPDVYVKGSDYENPEEDVTGKIVDEREAVEEHGGRLVFTHDITFSSSSLINRYLDVYDTPLKDHLDEMRANDEAPRIFDLIERVRDQRLLFVGETIIDEYHYVEPLNKSAKENLIATRFLSAERFAGGVIAAANHAADFCAEVEVVTMMGGHAGDGDEELIRAMCHPNVRLTIIRRPEAPTVTKRRFVDAGYLSKMYEVQFLDDSPLDEATTARLNAAIAERARAADATVVADFGHGMIGPATVATLVDNARFLAVNAQSNSANMGYNLVTKYPRADYVCIDAPEARLAVQDRFSDIAVVTGEMLPARLHCGRIIVTHGKHGCCTFDAERGIHRIPAFTRTVTDTMGAGDAFLAVTAPLVAAGGDMGHVGFVGNAVGALKVGIVGHRRSVEKLPVIRYITALLK